MGNCRARLPKWRPGLSCGRCHRVSDRARSPYLSGMTQFVDRPLDPEPVRDRVLALLRANRSRLADRYGVWEFAVFGSVARGEATETSDVDVIVECDPDQITLTSFLDFTDDLEALLHRRVDVVSLPKLTPRLRAHVEAEALRVA